MYYVPSIPVCHLIYMYSSQGSCTAGLLQHQICLHNKHIQYNMPSLRSSTYRLNKRGVNPNVSGGGQKSTTPSNYQHRIFPFNYTIVRFR